MSAMPNSNKRWNYETSLYLLQWTALEYEFGRYSHSLRNTLAKQIQWDLSKWSSHFIQIIFIIVEKGELWFISAKIWHMRGKTNPNVDILNQFFTYINKRWSVRLLCGLYISLYLCDNLLSTRTKHLAKVMKDTIMLL